MEREAKGISAFVGRVVEDLYVRVAGEEWVERLRRREEAKTQIVEAQATQNQAEARNRVRAGHAADTRQRREDLKLEQEAEAFDVQKAERRQAERARDLDMDERVANIADRRLDQERDEFKLRVCSDMADALFGALHRMRREGRLLELTPDQISALIQEASERASNAIECSVERRVALSAH